MSKTTVFGAGGRAGRAAVQEAVSRGHQVTAVVRDPAKYPDLAGDNVTVVAGDAQDADSVAAACAGQDAVIAGIADLGQSSDAFYTAASKALVDGMAGAGVGRLAWVGIATTLEVATGLRMMDTDEFPAEGKAFSLGHAIALDTFEASDASIDWVSLAPPPALVEGERTGTYTLGDIQLLEGQLTYADLAVALVDQLEKPTHHRRLVAITGL